MGKSRKLSVEDIEAMTSHEIADFLATLILVLRRMPNERLGDLKAVEQPLDTSGLAAAVRHERNDIESHKDLPDWVEGSEDE